VDVFFLKHGVGILQYTSSIPRVQSLTILGVTISSKLSVAEHVCNIIRSSAQTCHALRLLQAHGMANTSLQVVYRAVITAKLTYAASAWWGFTTEIDRQRLEAIIRRGNSCSAGTRH